MAEEKAKEAPKTEPAAAAPAAPASKDEKKAKKSADNDAYHNTTTMHVKLYSPYQTYFDEEAESVSAENATGPFDVLPQHHNFITLLNACEVDIKSKKAGDKAIKIARGVMHVQHNKVTIFLDV